MIVGLGTGTLFSSLALPRNLIGVADAEGEFLVTDDGTFVVDDAGRYILTNTQIKTIVTDTGDTLVDDLGNSLIEYNFDGETTSAPDPE
jgi:hypothetical protein